MRPVVAGGRADTDVFPKSALDTASSVNEEAFPYEATIWTAGGSEDGGGDVSEGFTQGATVPARIGPIGSSNTIGAGGRVSEESTHVVTLGRAVSLSLSDELEIDGRRYAVTAAPSYGSWESAHRFEVRAN